MCHFTIFSHAIVALFFVMIFEKFSEGGEMNKVHGIFIF
jgi:hypothetical protein